MITTSKDLSICCLQQMVAQNVGIWHIVIVGKKLFLVIKIQVCTTKLVICSKLISLHVCATRLGSLWWTHNILCTAMYTVFNLGHAVGKYTKDLLFQSIVLNLLKRKFSTQFYLGHLNLPAQDTNFPVWLCCNC